MSKQRKELGFKGEQLVANYLKQRNITICTQNYSNRYGEIDIIAQNGEALLFVEVKTRNNPDFCTSQLITLSKQKKIIKAARSYIAINKLYNMIYRFDVALVTTNLNELNCIDYIKNAFTDTSCY